MFCKMVFGFLLGANGFLLEGYFHVFPNDLPEVQSAARIIRKSKCAYIYRIQKRQHYIISNSIDSIVILYASILQILKHF